MEIIFFAEEKKNREVKGGKYLEKENYFFCGGYMRRLRRLYEEKEKKPGIGRYPMGPTNIDVVNIGSQHC